MRRLVDFDHVLCGPDVSIRTALERINNERSDIFQIVVDADRRVIGTVTDGDVRRAMLRGVGLDEPVSRCMNRSPAVGSPTDATENRAKLRDKLFLPVVDETAHIQHVLVLGQPTKTVRRALVLAGGFGKRLGARTESVPKPLLEVGGKPILDHILGQLEDNGFESISVAVHYRADQIETFVADRSNQAQVDLVREDRPLGTAGALGLLSEPLDEPILVMNGDLVTQIDYGALQEFHAEHDHDATVAVSRYEVHVPFGVLRHGEDGLFAGIDEKPTYPYFVAAGIYLLGPQIVALVAQGESIDMPALLEAAHAHGMRIGLFPLHEYWIDVGRPDDLMTADHDQLRRLQPVPQHG